MRLILTLMLMTFTAPAWAEWVKMGETDIATLYYGAAIKKKGNFRRVWTIQDLKQRTKEGVMSRRALEEFDCEEKRYRILSLSGHSKRMGRGKLLTIFNYSPPSGGGGEWNYVPPSTGATRILNIVCK